MQWWILVLVCAAVLQSVLTTKVLFLGPISSKSHKNFYMGIVNALADDNIQVTMVSPFKPSKVREKWFLRLVFQARVLLCFPFYIGEPSRVVSTSTINNRNTRFPSYDASFMLDFKHPMTFMERAISSLSDVAMDAMLFYYLSPRMESECRRRGLCPDDMPSFFGNRFKCKSCTDYSAQTIDYPSSYLCSSRGSCGGIPLRPSQPLSKKDLEDWVQDGGDAGFIFFSLGSAVTPSSMPGE
nr:uncharacterized protein LOC128686301 [Cherax quadricarinatus]